MMTDPLRSVWLNFPKRDKLFILMVKPLKVMVMDLALI